MADHELGWLWHSQPASGYGVLQRRLAERLGWPAVQFRDHWDATPAVDCGSRYGTKARQWAANKRAAIGKTPPPDPRTRDAVRLNVSPVWHFLWDGAKTRVGYTMWEASRVPVADEGSILDFKAWLDNADVLITPSRHCTDIFSEALPRKPIYTVPLGVDPQTWKALDRTANLDRDLKVFVTVGDMSYRKGWDFLMRAWNAAFAGRRDVLLVIKVRGDSLLMMPTFKGMATWWCKYGTLLPLPMRDGTYPVHYPHGEPSEMVTVKSQCWRVHVADETVKVIRGDWRLPSLMKLYQMADCFLWPTRGEGYGLPPREAAATAMPVITCAHTGQDDADRWALTIPWHQGCHARTPMFGDTGYWYEPDFDAFVEAMRLVADRRDVYFAQAQAASQYIHRRTWDQVAQEVKEIIR